MAPPDVERAVQVHLELGRAVAERGEGRDRDQFAAFQIQARTLVDIAEGA